MFSRFKTALGAMTLIVIAPCALSAAAPARSAPTVRTNLLLITLDTTRADRLGCYGYSPAATPTLDALARAGTVFESALSPAPITLVSHASIFTGLSPRRHEIRDNVGFKLADAHPTLASILKASGYQTAAAVSSAVLDRGTGIGRGFTTYDDRVRIGARSEFNFEERAASQVTDAARNLLGAAKAPFFLWVHYYDPHAPYVPPAPFRERFASQPYDGEIAFMDRELGKLLAALQAKYPNTLIVIAGDHGESLGEHAEDRHDLFVYQATQRVPLIVKGPKVAAGRRVKRNVGLVDVMPTVLDLLGVKRAGTTDGSSLASLLAPGPLVETKAEPYEMESFFPAYAYNWAPSLAVVDGRSKYIAAPTPELYDLAADPKETKNLLLGNTIPASSRQLASRLAGILRQRHAGDPEAAAFGAPYCSKAIIDCEAPAAVANGKGTATSGASEDDDERRERLASLGYAGGSAVPGRTPPPGPHRDPKEGVDIIRGLDRARERMNAGKGQDAVRLLEPLVATDPRNFPLLATLGGALGMAGSADRAIDVHRSTVQLRPDYGLAHSNLAMALRAKATTLPATDPRFAALMDESAAELERALKLNPRDSESYLRLAELELARSRPEAARTALERAETADAGDPEIFLLRGRVEATLGNAAKARASFDKALALDPLSGEAHEALGRLAYVAGDARKAAEHYARALELAPSVAIAKTLGSIRLYALSDRQGAVAAFRRARELTRDPAETAEIDEAIREAVEKP